MTPWRLAPLSLALVGLACGLPGAGEGTFSDRGAGPPLEASRSEMDDGALAGVTPRAAPEPCAGADPVVACADPACAGTGACCVGDGDCCAPVEGLLPAMVSFAACADGASYAACATGLSGMPVSELGVPRVGDEGLYPGGDAASDGGLVLGEAVDLRTHRVRLDVAFALPDEGACPGGCVESAGVGLSAQAGLEAAQHVRPLAALLYSAGRDEVLLVVADEVVRRFPRGDSGAPWTLTVRPTGELTVAGAGGVDESFHYPPAAGARLVLYGRSENRGADGGAGARIASVAAAAALCDAPAAWTSREALRLFAGGAPFAAPLSGAPAAALDGEAIRLAFVAGGALVSATERAGDPGAFELDAGGAPAVSTDAPWRAAFVGDPELVVDGGAVHLFFGARSDQGRSAIGHALRQADGRWAVDPEPLALVGADLEPLTVASPSVLRHYAGLWVLAAMETLQDGVALVSLFRSADLVTWTTQGSLGLDTLTRRDQSVAAGRFDADEVAAPSLRVHNGVWQLHYAGRRGARWAVGLLVSDDLVSWRRVADEDPVLGGSGEGFDAVGVRAPSLLALEGSVRLYYEGTDGAFTGLGVAERPAPAFAGWL